MTHPNLILKRMQFPTIHLHLPRSKYALTRSYEFGHYRSFWKVNKNSFFVKASYMSMEYQNEMRPKGLIRGNLKISKKVKEPLQIVKIAFLPKLITRAWNIKMRWDQKGWLEDISRFLKIPITPPKVHKLKKLCIVEVGHFSKFAKSQLSSKLQFLTKGPTFFHLIWSYQATHVSHIWFHGHSFIFLFYLILFDLIHFKSFKIK